MCSKAKRSKQNLRVQFNQQSLQQLLQGYKQQTLLKTML